MSSSIPSTMKQVLIHKTGGPEVLEFNDSASVPQPKDGEVLVKNEFAGINYIDTYFRSGLYPGNLPLCLGQEAAGTIAKIQGENKYGFKEGDNVVWIKQGSYADYTTVAADRVIKIPDGISKEDAVGGFLMGMTVLSLVHEAYPVQKGDTVLIHAAAGGVGLLMCQVLKDMGAHIIGTAGSPEKCKLAKEAGANECVDYNANKDWPEKVKQLTPNNEGVSVVYDSVGASTWEGSLEVVKRKGKVVYFGNASGPVPPFPIARLTAKNTSVMRATLMNYIVTREELEHYADMLFKLMQDGKLKVKHHEAYDLKDVQRAHKDLEGRKTTGKLLLKL